MRVLITPVESEDGQEIRSLYRWLSNDAAVAKRMKLHIEPVNDQLGSMGGASDAITAMFADGSAVAAIGSLFVSYRTWRDTRRMPPALKIEKDGVTVLLNSGSEQDVRRALEVLLPSIASAADIGNGEEVERT